MVSPFEIQKNLLLHIVNFYCNILALTVTYKLSKFLFFYASTIIFNIYNIEVAFTSSALRYVINFL